MISVSASTDLRSMFGAARHQRHRPTCLAFATSDAHAAVRGAWKPLSCEYLFHKAQARQGRLPTQGTFLGDTMAALREDGQPEEAGWPYSPTPPVDLKTWEPPNAPGPLFRRNSEYAARTFTQICQLVDQKRPVILLCKLSACFYRPVGGVVVPESGEKPDPNIRHAVVAAGHGVANGDRYLLVRNSWGQKWGEGGYGWLPESYVDLSAYAAAALKEEIGVFTSNSTT